MSPEDGGLEPRLDEIARERDDARTMLSTGDALQALFDAERAAGRRMTVHTPRGGLGGVTVELR